MKEAVQQISGQHKMLKIEGVRVAVAGAVIVLAGCGGEEGGKGAVCSDFKYQEDAQAAYNAGAKQLDGDHDGVACESLPHRPARQASTPATSYTSKISLNAEGSLIYLGARSDGYSFVYSDLGGGIGGATGPVVPTSAGGGQQVTAIGRSVRYFRTSDGTLLSWVPARETLGPAPGIGLDGNTVTTFAELSGTYKLLGQRCSPSTYTCNPVAATARITADGTLRLCIGSEYSDSCSGGVSRILKSVSTSVAIPNAWNLGASGENLIASKTRGTVAFSYRDNRLDANQQPISTDNFAFFGQLESVTSGPLGPSVAMLSFDVNGQWQSGVPESATWTVSAGQPLAGFFQDGVGNTYLLSSSGQLVTWTVGSGLRIYSKP